MGNIFDRIGQVIGQLSLMRKLTMGIVLTLSIGVVGYMVHVARQASLEPLFTNLNSDDIGEIVTRLDKQGVHYELDRDKRTVMVPSTDVLKVRLKLAEEGLPRFGGVGFELFDRSGFGMSEFEQRVNYQRALEGELTRTIGSIREIENARVHLVLPEKSLFADSQQEASASVVLKLGNAATLGQATVRSIQNLVASAVEGLDPTKVTIVDTAGHLLTSGSGDASVAAGSQVLDQKLQIERNYERRIVELLTPVVGLSKVLARVTATIDFTQTENTDESVDPQKVAVLSESRTAAKRSESAGGTGGAAGAAANVPGGGGAGASGSGGSSDESTEQIQYAVSRTILKKVTPIGAVQKLSVAVLVDGMYEEKDGKKTYKARDPKSLTQIEELVKRAIGFDQERGDQLKVENIEFQNPESEMQAGDSVFAKRSTYGFLISVIGNVLVVVVALLVIFFVVRPLVQSWRAARIAQLGPGGGQLLLEGEVGGDVGTMVRADPSAAANAIRQWLQ